MRKKFTKMVAFLVVAVLSLGLVASANFPDVPSDHWAYDAVTTLVDEGLLSGMPDGTFSGTEPMNRYSVAVLVSRLLDRIEAQPASVVERVIQQPITVNQPVQPVIEKTIERVIQEPVEVTKVVEKEYIEKPVDRIIEKHIVHDFAGLTEAQVLALIDEKLADLKLDLKDRSEVDAQIFQLTSNKLKTLTDEVASVGTEIAALNADLADLKLDLKDRGDIDAQIFQLTSNKLKALTDDVATFTGEVTALNSKVDGFEALIDEKIANSDSSKSVNELKDQLEAQNDKLLAMEKQIGATRTIAVLGLLAGIAGIVVGFVVK